MKPTSIERKRKAGALLLFAVFLLSALVSASCETGNGGFSPPEVSAVGVDVERARGPVSIFYDLADENGLPLQVMVEIRLDGGEWFSATALPGGGKGMGFIAGEGVERRVFVWDSLTDTGRENHVARARVSVLNPAYKATAESAEFELVNGDALPWVQFQSVLPEDEGVMAMALRVGDDEGGPLDLRLEYSVDAGENFFDATVLGQTEDIEMNGESFVAHTLRWKAGEDLLWTGRDTVRLRATASDGVGAGESALSDLLRVDLELDPRVEIAQPLPSVRGETPLVFTIYGPPERRYRADVAYVVDESLHTCTQIQRPTDSTANLMGAPEGLEYTFFWDTLADLPDVKTRELRVSITLLDAEGRSLDPAPQVFSDAFGVDNAPLKSGIVLGEIYTGVNETDAFIELIGTPETRLDGFRLYEIWADGFTGESVERAFLHLDGQVIGSTGIFVIGGPEHPTADFRNARFGTFFKEDYPFNIILDFEPDGVEYDSLGIGDFTGAVYWGEGDPADVPPDGKSLTREFANTDANDNRTDFVVRDPTPGQAWFWTEPN